jgi:predicted nucleotidyltransferase
MRDLPIDRLPVPVSVREALQETHAALHGLYGERLAQLVLFGSQARGHPLPESDVDVMVVLRGPFRLYDEIKRTSPLELASLLKHEVPISFLIFEEDRFHDPSDPLMMNVYQDGILL